METANVTTNPVAALLRAAPHAMAAFDGGGAPLGANQGADAILERLGPLPTIRTLEAWLAGLRRGTMPVLHDAKEPVPGVDGGRAQRLLPDGTGLEISLGVGPDGTRLLELRFRRRLVNDVGVYREFEALVGGGRWEIDLVSDEMLLSSGVWRMLGAGARRGLATLERWRAHVHEADRAEFDGMVERVSRKQVAAETEYRMQLPNGERRTIAARGRPVVDVEGRTVRMAGVFRDVTEKRERERRLQERETQLRTLLENLPDVVLVLDADGTIRFVNSPVQAIAGYAPDALVGENFTAYLHAQDQADATESFARRLREPGTKSFAEWRLYNAGGASRRMQVQGVYLPEAPGIRGLLLVLRDVTELRELESHLYQSQKLEAIGRLASGVAHDFNNVLTAIQGNAELLRGRLDREPSARQDAEAIVQAAKRAGQLTRRLLAAAHSERGVDELVEVEALVEEVQSVLARSVSSKVCVVMRFGTRHEQVWGDASQIHAALVNLGVNAAEAMPAGGTTMLSTTRVTLLADEARRLGCDPGMHVALAVSDTGPGLRPEELERVFDPFYSTKSESTGLGLATVYACARSHNGGVRTFSEEGSGTTFELLLPLGAAPDRTKSSSATGHGTRLAKGLRVLVVDDEAGIRRYCRNALATLGHAAEEAADGDAALVRVRADGPAIDLMVLDLSMPGRHGFDVLTALNEEPKAAGITVIVSSGHTDERTEGNLRAAGAAGSLQKPYSIDELEQAIAHVLS